MSHDLFLDPVIIENSGYRFIGDIKFFAILPVFFRIRTVSKITFIDHFLH